MFLMTKTPLRTSNLGRKQTKKHGLAQVLPGTVQHCTTTELSSMQCIAMAADGSDTSNGSTALL